MGFANFVRNTFGFFGSAITRGLFLWWLSVILMVDILLVLYHLFVANLVYPPMALFMIEMIAFFPVILIVILAGGKNGRLRNKAEQRRRRKDYAGLESRTRF